MNMDVNLADLVAAVGDALPDRCALVCDGDRLSYPELTARSNQVAQHLAAAGLAPDEPVGLYLLNSTAYIEALLGCMVARTIPVNINYRYTGHELANCSAARGWRGSWSTPSTPGWRRPSRRPAPPCGTWSSPGGSGSPPPRFPDQVTVVDYAPAVAAAPASRRTTGAAATTS